MNFKRKGRITLILSVVMLCTIIVSSIVIAQNNYFKGNEVLSKSEENKEGNIEENKR